MKKLMSMLLLLLLSGAAMADSSASFLSTPAVANHTDISVAFLDEVFGTVGNVLTGVSGQMMGHLFYKLNQGIIIVAGLWLVYTVFQIAFNIANDGAAAAMGNAGKTVVMVVLKILLGFVLLIPNPSTGYSILQDVVMKVVVEGVGLADETWNYGLKYIANGGGIWHMPQQSGLSQGDVLNEKSVTSLFGSNSTNTSSTRYNATPTVAGQQIFFNEVCMLSSNDNDGIIHQSAGGKNIVLSGAGNQYNYVISTSNNRINFPGNGDQPPFGDSSTGCGYVQFNLRNSCVLAASGADQRFAVQCSTARNTIVQLVDNIMPAARKYYCHLHPDSKQCYGLNTDDTVTNDLAPYFFNSVANYYNGVMPIAKSVESNGQGSQNATAALKKRFIENAQAQGWLSAGRYYWDLSQAATAFSQLNDVASYVPSHFGGPDVSKLNPQIRKDYQSASSVGVLPVVLTKVNSLIDNYDTSQTSGYTQDKALNCNSLEAMGSKDIDAIVKKRFPNDAKLQSEYRSKLKYALKDCRAAEKDPSSAALAGRVAKDFGGDALSAGTSLVENFPKAVGAGGKKLVDGHPVGAIKSYFSSIGSLFTGGTKVMTKMVKQVWTEMFDTFGSAEGQLISLFSYSTGYDPIVFLHKVGIACINLTGQIWIGIGLGVALTIAVFKSCLGFLGAPATAIMSWLRTMFMAIASLLWVVGFLLAYFVPMYPYLIFTLGVIGWLISVIEAMVAAPLVCLGLTHPEGHDFLGKAQQSLMLLLGVFMQPVLMVIGLIAGMIMSYVSLRIVLYTFTGFISDLFTTNLATGMASISNDNVIHVAKSALNPHGNLIINATNSVTGVATNLVNSQLSEFHFYQSDYLVPLLVVPLILVIFTGLVYVVTTQSFSLIYVLRDNALRWIGVPGSGLPAPAQALQQVQGAFSSAGGGLGRAVGDSSQAFSQGAQETMQSGKQAMSGGANQKGGGATASKKKSSSSSSSDLSKLV